VEDFSLLKQALPYIKQYRNKTFVIKFGGEVVQQAERMDAIAADIALLHELNIRMVIIHGGGPQATKLAEDLKIESEKVEGRRITNDRMLEVVKMVFAGQISTDILSHLRRHDTPGIGLSGVDGELVDAVRRPPKKFTDPNTGEAPNSKPASSRIRIGRTARSGGSRRRLPGRGRYRRRRRRPLRSRAWLAPVAARGSPPRSRQRRRRLREWSYASLLHLKKARTVGNAG